MTLLVVVGLLLYGRNLPQAGRTMGRFVAQLKRGFHDFKEQMDRDESLREVRKTFEETSREMRNLTVLPRAIANPAAGLRSLAHEAVTAPPPPDDVADEPPPPAAPAASAPAEPPATPPGERGSPPAQYNP